MQTVTKPQGEEKDCEARPPHSPLIRKKECRWCWFVGLLVCCCWLVVVCCCVLLCVVVVVVVVVVEWLHYSKRIILDKRADLSDFFFVDCRLVSRPMKIVTFPWKNADPAKRVVDFPLEGDTFRNKKHGHRRGFPRKKLQQQRQTLEIVEDFACESTCLHFSFCFHHFCSFFRFFSYFLFFSIFSFFPFFHLSFFSFFSFFFIFFHVLPFSFFFFHVLFFFFHFLSFSVMFIFFIGCSNLIFLGLNFVTIS